MTIQPDEPFDAGSLFDDLDYLPEATAEVPDLVNPSSPPVDGFKSICPKCRGSGRFRGYSGRDFGPCRPCQGRGFTVHATTQEQRDKQLAQRQARKARTVDQWRAEHPAETEWLRANCNRSDFAHSLVDALIQYGHLTENQLAAVTRSIARDAERAVERAKLEADAKPVELDKIEAAFARASARLRSPLLRVGGFHIKPAAAHSKNAGSLYVTHEGEYLGRITTGKFVRSFKCTAEQEQDVIDLCADPADAAVRYGRLTGNCAICGQLLRNAESLARGIGPICASNFGF